MRGCRADSAQSGHWPPVGFGLSCPQRRPALLIKEKSPNRTSQRRDFVHACREHTAVLLHRGSSVFDRTADPGYVLSGMEKYHAGEREAELRRRGFSQARKNDAKLAGATYLYGDMEKRNSSAADSKERNICWPIAGLSSANEVFGCK